MAEAGERSIGYQPALDGVRAVAVVLVLLFHLGFSWMSGGYLGVSVFFTLSGFLITTLLASELKRSGTIALGRFYGRRARRLLPASIVCLAGVCILIATDQVPDRSGLRWYVFGGLLQFANWVPLGLRNSYAALFDTPSPLDHFWSLAIEEQFYWLWPVSMLGLFRLVTGKHRSFADWSKRIAIALGVLFVLFGISAPLTASLWNHDAAYFATWARIPEILAGALLAVIALRTGIPTIVRWLAPLGLAAILVLSAITPAGRGLAYEGALPLFALISAGLIAGLQHPTVVSRMLSLPPIVFLGRISYGVYLYHWPVFVVLSQGRTELDVIPLSVLRLSVTLAIALVSYFVIEQPIRERRFLTKPRIGLAATSFAIPLVALLGITQVSNTSSFEQPTETLPPAAGTLAPLVTPPATGAAATTVASPVAPGVGGDTTVMSESVSPAITTTMPATTTTVTLVPARPVRILIIGDSTAQVTGVSLVDWAGDNPQLGQVEVQAFGGCGILDEGDRFYRGQWEPTSPGCVTLLNEHVPERIAQGRPDIVVVVSSFWDNTDHRWPGDPTALSPLDSVYRERALPRFEAYNQLLLDSGAPRVAWVLYPPTDESWDAVDETSDDPARYVAFDALTRDAAAPFPGRVSTIDLSAWVDEQGLTNDHDARPDGVHFSESQSRTIVDTFLANAIIQAALH